jgi:hypothetical protein
MARKKGTGAPAPAPQVHSVIGASSYYRWKRCAGSVRLSKGIPTTSSKYAEEGTEAHEYGALRLTTGKWPKGVPSDMREAVEVYVNLIEQEKVPGGPLFIEHPFDLSEIHPGLFGTCDAVIFDSRESLLRIYDYKHGSGIPVEVERNEQLMYYGLGALLSTQQVFECDEVELTIVQPRCYHEKGPIRRWRFPAYELLDFAADLKEAAVATENPAAPLNAGDHCRFCPAAGICPEIENKAKAAAQGEFGEIIEYRSGLPYDPNELAKRLAWLPTLEHWIEGLRNFAYAEAVAGRTPPGYKLVAKRGTRKWEDEEKAAKYLQTAFPSSAKLFFEEPTLKSVAQVEKVLHKNQHDKIACLYANVSSGEVLVPVSDPRPEVKAASAQDQFSEIESANASEGVDIFA